MGQSSIKKNKNMSMVDFQLPRLMTILGIFVDRWVDQRSKGDHRPK
jgi:hypothetical protein